MEPLGQRGEEENIGQANPRVVLVQRDRDAKEIVKDVLKDNSREPIYLAIMVENTLA